MPSAINQNLDIEGPGASQLTVSGGGLSQVFDVAAGTTVTIAGLTITGGVDSDGIGGGIMNAGNLTLKNDSVTGNCFGLRSGVGFNAGTHAHGGRQFEQQRGNRERHRATLLISQRVSNNQANCSRRAVCSRRRNRQSVRRFCYNSEQHHIRKLGSRRSWIL